MTITFIGHGYVGLVTACVFADLGNTVYVIGRNQEKLNRLSKGDPIIYEPGLEELLKKNLLKKTIIFTTEYSEAISKSDIVFIAVGTPPNKDGSADTTNVYKVAENIGKNLKKEYTVVSCKSTVPIGTNRKIKKIIESVKKKNVNIDVVSCPEFLREGTALQDTFYPDRIIIGSDSKKAIKLLLDLHKPLSGKKVITGLESAEIIKYASNSLLAAKISFANLISFYCDKTDADVHEVLEGVGLDRRIGHRFLQPGIGYGGSCFPKDVKALLSIGNNLNIDTSFLQAIEHINSNAQNKFIKKIVKNIPTGKIALWGLSFKPNTDDVRDAPALNIIKELSNSNYQIQAYDPEATENTKKTLGNNYKITYYNNPYKALKNTQGLVIATEWNEFKQIDLVKVKNYLKSPIIIDGRNIYELDKMKSLGFTYISVGRKQIFSNL